jgi:rhomboid protease GluP
MPAILCPSCRKLISSDEKSCIHCGQMRPGMWGLTSLLRQAGIGRLDFPHLITVTCIALYVLSIALDPAAALSMGGGFMNILSPSGEATYKLGMAGVIPVLVEGRWWTVFTAVYLHGSLLHIFFNVMWVRQLGPLVEDLFGPFRLFIIYTVAGVAGFVLSALMNIIGVVFQPMGFSLFGGAGYTLGASGGIFGLLAAAIVYGSKMGSSLFTRQYWQWAIMLFVFGLIFPGVDNWAHLGGFIGGYVAAFIFSRGFIPPEGMAVYIGAGVCLSMTVLAFLLQFWTLFTGYFY